MAVFAPRWKFHPQHGAVLVTSAEQLAALGGAWADSPAAFGVETHPEVTAVTTPLPGLGSAVLPAPAPAADPLLAGRVVSLEAVVKQYESEIVSLAEAVRELQSRIMGAEAQLIGVSQHLAHLSEAKPAAPEPKPDPKPGQPQGGGPRR